MTMLSFRSPWAQCIGVLICPGWRIVAIRKLCPCYIWTAESTIACDNAVVYLQVLGNIQPFLRNAATAVRCIAGNGTISQRGRRLLIERVLLVIDATAAPIRRIVGNLAVADRKFPLIGNAATGV